MHIIGFERGGLVVISVFKEFLSIYGLMQTKGLGLRVKCMESMKYGCVSVCKCLNARYEFKATPALQP